MSTLRTRATLGVLAIPLLLLAPARDARADNQPCFDCHGESDMERDGGKPGDLFVNPDVFGRSVHQDLGCNDCHKDAILKDSEHPTPLAKVACAECHAKEAGVYAGSTHGKRLAAGDALAPKCSDCHGDHDIFPPTDRRSKNYRMNIPRVCGQCHAEGRSVAAQRELGEKGVVEAYRESIHWEGLFKRGLLGAAVCSDCHGSHDVRPHEDPGSGIARANVAKTCMRCHGEIEQVHVKVINEKLWEETPGAIPACVDCHQPHSVRRVHDEKSLGDADCMACHGQADLKGPDGRSLAVDAMAVHDSAHVKVTCAMCHSNLVPGENPPCLHVGKVDCSKCHAQAALDSSEGMHGKFRAQGSTDAPGCTTCHGTHAVKPRTDPTSPIAVRNIPELCGKCHHKGEIAARLRSGATDEVVEQYEESIHGKGLLKSGLLVTAVCTSCHTAHRPLPGTDPRSSVAPSRVAETCGKCHDGVRADLKASVHHPSNTRTSEKLPTCNDCHESHAITRVDAGDFRRTSMDRCGKCHQALTEAYFDTYHGKASQLGTKTVAECADCHSSHRILSAGDPDSTVSRNHIVETCAKCHPGAHRRFAGYLNHATHKDPDKYPFLYYTFWFMTFLLLGTLAFFSLHTLLWLPRSFKLMLERRKHPIPDDEPHVQRFGKYHRVTHLLVILSFFGLAITGMTLKFSYTGWAQVLANVLGGQESAALIHRVCAAITFVYFGMHIVFLWRNRRERKIGWFKMILHPESMLPNLRDLKEFGQTIRWFVGRGERPDYGRFTYWEKFDYLAVFWGVAVIGMTGLVLWFPELFTYVLPGWFVNVATIIHSDEALLAAGFIFTVHFFNTHFRPERFPMDPVIFTGAVPLSEFREERPREYRQAVEEGRLEAMLVPKPDPKFVRRARVFGLSMLTLGLSLIALIVYAMLFAYK